jgi:diaminopropionate ammonia-lyase
VKVLLNSGFSDVSVSSPYDVEDIFNFHKTLPGYTPTPLVFLNESARDLGVESILVKDEGKRFGLKAFKALGASYAVFRLLRERSGGALTPDEFLTEKGRRLSEGVTFSCATDGNHGRAVAWIARLLRRPAVIFMPQDSVPARIQAIESEGAEVIVVPGGYDEAVRCAAAGGEGGKRLVIADTGYPGYMDIPRYIQMGYLTLFQEVSLQLRDQRERSPDLVFLQAGVGAFASAAALFYGDPSRDPRLISVEPITVDCLFRSAEVGDGQPHSIESAGQTIMAGLNCETPSHTAWPLIRDRFNAFVSIEDHYAAEAMQRLAVEGMVAGESGAAGLAALIALCREKPDFFKEQLRVNRKTRILVINTEADTDPDGYYRIVGKTADEVECIT